MTILQTNQNINISNKIDIRDLQGSGQTILVVDDDDLMREFLQEILTLNGYNTLSAKSSKRAQIIFNSYDQKIDLIVSEMELNGVEEMISFIMKRNLKPILLYTDIYTNMSCQSSIAGFEVIEKPFDIVKLFKLVQSLIQVKLNSKSSITSNQISC